MIRQTTLSVAIMLCAVAFGGTVKVPLKTGWRFVKADDPAAGTNLTLHAMSAILDRAEKGEALVDSDLPAFTWTKPEFDDSAWRNVRVPHDWGVDSPFDSDRPYGDAFLDVTGVGWYRLKLKVDGGALKVEGGKVSVPQNGRIIFECDGAMSLQLLVFLGRRVVLSRLDIAVPQFFQNLHPTLSS